jgi:UDP-N-acetyl-D-glucosamine dehydrogenase
MIWSTNRLVRDMQRSSSQHEKDSAAAQLSDRITNRNAVVGIIGMGYVGLPLMLACVSGKFRVLGFDVDGKKIKGLNSGSSPLKHIGDASIASVRAAQMFEATGDFARLSEADVIIICVPTPIGKHREPDLSFIIRTTQDIARTLHPGQLVVLESTTYPGTTTDVVRPILEAGGLKSGSDFFLAFSPEREDPGNAHFSTSTIPKVVGGDGETASRLATAFYKTIIDRVVTVSSTETAEAVKITENVFRAVNIALVNELKIIYSKMNIDIFEVIEAAKTKPFGYMPFYPGPGLGGHCIPIDPFYLTWKAREHGINTRFIELAGEINSDMPRYVVDRLATVIDRRRGIGLSHAKVLVVGVAYKKNVDDMRESPALVIIELLKMRGTSVDYHDPHVPAIPRSRAHAGLTGMRSVSVDPQSVAAYDAVLIVTDHSDIDWEALVRSAQLVVDTRNVTAKIAGGRDNVFTA